MKEQELTRLLEAVAAGQLNVEDAKMRLKMEPFDDLGFAKLDTHRELRQGVAEVIYGASKNPDQIIAIARKMRENGQGTVLITRLGPEAAKLIEASLPLQYNPLGKVGTIGELPKPDGLGQIMIVTGGTSDIPVAEEAAVTAEALGNEVLRLYDVGVAGLHRLLAHTEAVMRATVIIAIAGMEGALASVVGGLASCPVIAVPTSVGYGASFNGLAALLSMLNSCATGVSVVNIDNGFGAAYMASMINHIGVK